MNRTIVIDDWTKPVMRALRSAPSRTPRGPPRRGRRARRRPGRSAPSRRTARRPPRAGAGCPVKSSVPSRNRATATSSAAISAAVARGPTTAGLAGDPQRREARLVGRAEVEPAGRERSGGGGRRRAAVGIGQRVLDRKSHVRGAQLGLQGAVHEPDGRVDDALRVDDHLDRVVADIVQPVRLDDLQALVGERRRVDRDLGAHRPGRVAERLLRRDRGELRRRRVEERPARCRQDERRDRRPSIRRRGTARSPSAPSRSGGARRAGWRTGRRGRVAATRGGQSARERHDEVAAGDERLLVGRGDDLAGAQRGEDRAEADDAAGRRRRRDRRRRGSRAPRGRRAGDAAVPAAGRGRASAASSPSATTPARSRAACSARSVAFAAGREGDDPERVRVRGEDVERLASDRAGRAEEGDAGVRAARRHRSANDGEDIQGHDRRGEQERVDAVEHPAVARDERARVLRAGRPLEHRLGEVAGLGGERRERPEEQRVERRSGRGPTAALATTTVAATMPPTSPA